MWEPCVVITCLCLFSDDEDTQQDMFNSDDEKDDAEEEADLKWRMERYEREKFISEQQV